MTSRTTGDDAERRSRRHTVSSDPYWRDDQRRLALTPSTSKDTRETKKRRARRRGRWWLVEGEGGFELDVYRPRWSVRFRWHCNEDQPRSVADDDDGETGGKRESSSVPGQEIDNRAWAHHFLSPRPTQIQSRPLFAMTADSTMSVAAVLPCRSPPSRVGELPQA